MDDKRTPMEAEVQELPQKRKHSWPGNFYGTSTKPRTKQNHNGLWICLSLIVIVVSTCSIVISLLNIRLDKQDGGWKLQWEPTETQTTENPVEDLEITDSPDYIPTPFRKAGSVQIRFAPSEGEALSPSEIYAQAAPAVVRVEVQTYYGSDCYTGISVSEDGYILSATDGLTNANSINVCFSDGRQYAASWVGEERASGLCLLKVEAAELPTVTFAQDDQLVVGQSVYCICNPYGSKLPNVFLDGMLAASGTVEAGGNSYSILQTSTQPFNGGYGCPILDGRGLVVGMTTPIGKRVFTGDDPCMAISAKDLTEAIEAFERNASFDTCWLGLEVEEIPEDYQYLYSFPGSIWIAEVAVESKAYGVLCQRDVITEVDGVQVSSREEFDKQVSKHKAGERVWLTFYRSGSWYRASVPVLAR